MWPGPGSSWLVSQILPVPPPNWGPPLGLNGCLLTLWLPGPFFFYLFIYFLFSSHITQRLINRIVDSNSLTLQFIFMNLIFRSTELTPKFILSSIFPDVCYLLSIISDQEPLPNIKVHESLVLDLKSWKFGWSTYGVLVEANERSYTCNMFSHWWKQCSCDLR